MTYVFEGTNCKPSAAYVWDENLETSKNPNITGDWTDVKNKEFYLRSFRQQKTLLDVRLG